MSIVNSSVPNGCRVYIRVYDPPNVEPSLIRNSSELISENAG